MASRKSKKPVVDYSVIWRDVLPRVLNACLLFCVLFNFIALGYGILKNNPKEVHHVDSFVTNHWFVVTQVVSSVNAPYSCGPAAQSFAAVDEVPPVVFSHYSECNGIPSAYIRHKPYRVGDILLGYPVEQISPDFVKWRGKYFKIDYGQSVLTSNRSPTLIEASQ